MGKFGLMTMMAFLPVRAKWVTIAKSRPRLFSLGHRIPGKACVMNFSCAIIFATNEAKGASSDDNGDNHVC